MKSSDFELRVARQFPVLMQPVVMQPRENPSSQDRGVIAY